MEPTQPTPNPTTPVTPPAFVVPPVAQTTLPTLPPKKKRHWMRWILGILLVLCIGAFFLIKFLFGMLLGFVPENFFSPTNQQKSETGETAQIPKGENEQLITNLTPYSTSFSFPEVPGAKGYGIYLEGQLVKIVTTASFAEDPVLMPETTYTYTIVPYDDITKVPQTIPQEATTSPTTFVPFLGTAFADEIPGKIQITFTTKALPDVPKSGEMKILVVKLGFTDKDGKKYEVEETEDSVRAKLFGSKDSVKEFYERNSYGRLAPVSGDVLSLHIPVSFDVEYLLFGYLLNGGSPQKEAVKSVYVDVNRKIMEQGLDTSKYNVVMYVLPYKKTGTIGVAPFFGTGGAPVGMIGDKDDNMLLVKGVAYINGVQKYSTYVHEIGHVLGLNHSASFYCKTPLPFVAPSFLDSCDVFGYGDLNDVMGSGSEVLDPLKKASLRWVSQEEITSTGRYDVFRDSSVSLVKRYISLIGKTDISQLYFQTYVYPPSSDRKESLFEHSLSFKFLFLPKPIPAVFKSTQSYAYGSFSERVLDLPVNVNIPHNRVRIFNLYTEKETEKIPIFVRFERKDETLITTFPNKISKNDLEVLWNPIPDSDGHVVSYRLLRDGQEIYDGQKNSFTDIGQATKKHVYKLVPYDSFSEIPGKKFYFYNSYLSNSDAEEKEEDCPPTSDAPSALSRLNYFAEKFDEVKNLFSTQGMLSLLTDTPDDNSQTADDTPEDGYIETPLREITLPNSSTASKTKPVSNKLQFAAWGNNVYQASADGGSISFLTTDGGAESGYTCLKSEDGVMSCIVRKKICKAKKAGDPVTQMDLSVLRNQFTKICSFAPNTCKEISPTVPNSIVNPPKGARVKYQSEFDMRNEKDALIPGFQSAFEGMGFMSGKDIAPEDIKKSEDAVYKMINYFTPDQLEEYKNFTESGPQCLNDSLIEWYTSNPRPVPPPNNDPVLGAEYEQKTEAFKAAENAFKSSLVKKCGVPQW